jgi:hypothetical protein
MAKRNATGVSKAVKRAATGAAGEALKTAGSAARAATGTASDVTGAPAVEGVGEQVQDVTKTAESAVERAGGGGTQRTVREELREIVREAALEVLVPVARKATMQAAMYAIKQGPQLAREMVMPKVGAAIEEAGGPGAFAKSALTSVSGARTGMLEKMGIGGESKPRPWRDRPLPVEESIDVVVPLKTVYGRFGEYGEYADVLSRGETVDERPNERIAWSRTDGEEATAVITFHRLSDRLTRVMVTYDSPSPGLLKRTASLFRTSSRGVNADLMRFKAFAEMSEIDTEPADQGSKDTEPADQGSKDTEASDQGSKDTESTDQGSEEHPAEDIH